MKKQIIIGTLIMAALAAYSVYNSDALTTERKTFVAACEKNNGIYAEGVLSEMEWRHAGCTTKTCDETKGGQGEYVLTFNRHDLVKPTIATLPGDKVELDAPRRRLERGKSYSVCMKNDHVLIDYYKSF